MEGARAAQYDVISDSSGLGGINTGACAAIVLDACYSTPAGDLSTSQDSTVQAGGQHEALTEVRVALAPTTRRYSLRVALPALAVPERPLSTLLYWLYRTCLAPIQAQYSCFRRALKLATS